MSSFVPALIILALAAACGAAGWRAMRNDTVSGRLLVALCLAAPLEVYRVPVGPLNLSVFRALLAVAAVWVVVMHLPLVRAGVRSGVTMAATVLTGVAVVSAATLTENHVLQWRLPSILLLGVVAVVVVAALSASSAPRTLLVGLAASAAPPVVAGAITQGILPAAGRQPGLPLVSHLTTAHGLEGLRRDISTLGVLGGRISGSFGDPNHFGVFLVVATCAAVALSLSSSASSTRLAWGVAAVAYVAMIVGTYSRTAWVSLVAVAVVFAILSLRRKCGLVPPRLTRGQALLSLAVVAVAAVPLAGKVASRVTSASANATSDQGHLTTMRAAWKVFRHHPLQGVGVGDLGRVLGEPPRVSGAHDTYLTILAELGIVGIVALLLLVVALLVPLLRRGDDDAGGGPVRAAMAAAVVALLLSNITYDVWFDDFWWVVFGAVTSLAVRASDADRQPLPVWVRARRWRERATARLKTPASLSPQTPPDAAGG